MPKQQITIELDIPEGYEATGEYRQATTGDIYLNIVGKPVIYGFGAYDVPEKTVGCYPILRKVKKYRTPIIPDDCDKTVEVSHDGVAWVSRKLEGYLIGYWRVASNSTWKYEHARIEVAE